MKFRFLSLVFLLLGLIIFGCDSSDDPVAPEPEKGKLAVFSTPAGAEIFLDGSTTNKITPDTVEADAGLYVIRLELEGYRDTTFSITITANQTGVVNVTLTEDNDLSFYGNVIIYETANSAVDQPSGIDLSAGQALGISESNPDRQKIDIYYSSNEGKLVRSAHLVQLIDPLSRNTYFHIGSSSNLNDGVNSPLQDASWEFGMDDDENNYAFLYDEDGHYSKLRIIERGVANNGVAWVKVEWYYNNTTGDTKF